ncbi:NAD(P)/FAD-dependent oxidoreductase [Methanosarcina sp. T3]|uniref:NAD(P)/FAD-dependent oxidoreductase n=1 Tax=Methanosarcina sp. T3 TaxID=3439062 RepID=UPI003F860EE4
MNSRPGEEMPVKVNATGPRNANLLARGIKFDTGIEKSYHMAFGDDIARGFYSYLLIKDGRGTIATVFGRKNLHHSEEFLQNTINYFSDYIDKREVASGKKFGGYGHFEIKKNLYDDNGSMLIGEAGGFQDDLWGFGMRYAIQSANFAARSIIDKEPYETLIKRNLVKKMEHSKRNRFIFETLGSLAYPAAYHLLAASKNPLKLFYMVYR